MTHLRENISGAVEIWLDKLSEQFPKFEYFKGGSTRFGYDTKTSDIDYYVYTTSYREFRTYLESEGFQQHKTSTYSSDSYVLGNINIVLHTNYGEFSIEQKNNNIIQTLLSNNPDLLVFIKQLREASIKEDRGGWVQNVFTYSGSNIFKILLKCGNDYST